MYCNDKIGSTTIAKKLNLSVGTVTYFLNKTVGLRSSKDAARKYTCNNDFFEKINTEEKAYWLGFIYADGYVMRSKHDQKIVSISLSSRDINHIEKFKECISATYPIHTYKASNSYSKNTMYSRISITSDKMFDDLNTHGVVENKTLILKAPDIPDNLIKDFIRGYIDGDGCITTHKPGKGRMVLQYAVKIVGTKNVLEFIKNFIENNHCATIRKFYKRHKNDNVYNIDFGGNKQVKKFLDIIYNGAHIFLNRKYEKYIDLCNLIHSRLASKDAS